MTLAPHALAAKEKGRWALLWLLATLYGVAGIAHIAKPAPFLLIVPDWVPFPSEIILVTGLCEIAGAIGLLLPRFRKFAGVMLALYAVCVFPANLKHALENIAVPGLPQSWFYHGPRLALQPVVAWLSLFAAGVIDWPFQGKRGTRD